MGRSWLKGFLDVEFEYYGLIFVLFSFVFCVSALVGLWFIVFFPRCVVLLYCHSKITIVVVFFFFFLREW